MNSHCNPILLLHLCILYKREKDLVPKYIYAPEDQWFTKIDHLVLQIL